MADNILKKWVESYPIQSFIILTYGLTIAVWSLILRLYGQASIDELFGTPSSILLIYLGAGAPAIIAVILTLITSGRAGLKDLGRRFRNVRVGIRVWLLALGIPFGIAFGCVAIFTVISDDLGAADIPAWYAIFPPSALLLFIAGPLCEETGWRGYLQPHLLARTTPIKAILVIGVVWCFWHIPLSFTPDTTPVLNTATTWMIYCLSSIVTAAILMAIVVAGRGSIFIAMIFHWASNAALGQVVMPLYPNAVETAWETVGLIHLGMTAVVAIGAVIWLKSELKR